MNGTNKFSNFGCIFHASRRTLAVVTCYFTIFGCLQTFAIDLEQFAQPKTAEAERLSPQNATLQKILVAFESVDVDDKDYGGKRYELFKKIFNEHIRLLHSTPLESADYVKAVTHANAYYDRLLKEDPYLISIVNRGEGPNPPRRIPPSIGANFAIPKIVITPAMEEELKTLSPQDAALKRVQFAFESVIIQDHNYESIRFELFKKYVNEHIRLKGSTPMEAIDYTCGVLGARAFYDILLTDDPRFSNREIGDTRSSTEPSFLSDRPMPPSSNAPLTNVPATPKPVEIPDPAKEKAAQEKKTVKPAPPMLNGWASVMRNYVKFENLPKAREYAKKIIDKYPDTPEAEEAKNVLQLKN